ncbi:hypothetical protein BLNAU_2791 [Blattamonas nauphoetae]|uniref:Uncharacterized protein n=1 Tax=Blattamonas nauphoetae TaxID=2049346 RepID=A0ABQ9YEB8_9EUKA|nr:hypothetical protein BLNAU_2791 [Blattamonas nauphoetae]
MRDARKRQKALQGNPASSPPSGHSDGMPTEQFYSIEETSREKAEIEREKHLSDEGRKLEDERIIRDSHILAAQVKPHGTSEEVAALSIAVLAKAIVNVVDADGRNHERDVPAPTPATVHEEPLQFDSPLSGKESRLAMLQQQLAQKEDELNQLQNNQHKPPQKRRRIQPPKLVLPPIVLSNREHLVVSMPAVRKFFRLNSRLERFKGIQKMHISIFILERWRKEQHNQIPFENLFERNTLHIPIPNGVGIQPNSFISTNTTRLTASPSLFDAFNTPATAPLSTALILLGINDSSAFSAQFSLPSDILILSSIYQTIRPVSTARFDSVANSVDHLSLLLTSAFGYSPQHAISLLLSDSASLRDILTEDGDLRRYKLWEQKREQAQTEWEEAYQARLAKEENDKRLKEERLQREKQLLMAALDGGRIVVDVPSEPIEDTVTLESLDSSFTYPDFVPSFTSTLPATHPLHNHPSLHFFLLAHSSVFSLASLCVSDPSKTTLILQIIAGGIDADSTDEPISDDSNAHANKSLSAQELFDHAISTALVAKASSDTLARFIESLFITIPSLLKEEEDTTQAALADRISQMSEVKRKELLSKETNFSTTVTSIISLQDNAVLKQNLSVVQSICWEWFIQSGLIGLLRMVLKERKVRIQQNGSEETTVRPIPTHFHVLLSQSFSLCLLAFGRRDLLNHILSSQITSAFPQDEGTFSLSAALCFLEPLLSFLITSPTQQNKYLSELNAASVAGIEMDCEVSEFVCLECENEEKLEATKSISIPTKIAKPLIRRPKEMSPPQNRSQFTAPKQKGAEQEETGVNASNHHKQMIEERNKVLVQFLEDKHALLFESVDSRTKRNEEMNSVVVSLFNTALDLAKSAIRRVRSNSSDFHAQSIVISAISFILRCLQFAPTCFFADFPSPAMKDFVSLLVSFTIQTPHEVVRSFIIQRLVSLIVALHLSSDSSNRIVSKTDKKLSLSTPITFFIALVSTVIAHSAQLPPSATPLPFFSVALLDFHVPSQTVPQLPESSLIIPSSSLFEISSHTTCLNVDFSVLLFCSVLSFFHPHSHCAPPQLTFAYSQLPHPSHNLALPSSFDDILFLCPMSFSSLSLEAITPSSFVTIHPGFVTSCVSPAVLCTTSLLSHHISPSKFLPVLFLLSSLVTHPCVSFSELVGLARIAVSAFICLVLSHDMKHTPPMSPKADPNPSVDQVSQIDPINNILPSSFWSSRYVNSSTFPTPTTFNLFENLDTSSSFFGIVSLARIISIIFSRLNSPSFKTDEEARKYRRAYLQKQGRSADPDTIDWIVEPSELASSTVDALVLTLMRMTPSFFDSLRTHDTKTQMIASLREEIRVLLSAPSESNLSSKQGDAVPDELIERFTEEWASRDQTRLNTIQEKSNLLDREPESKEKEKHISQLKAELHLSILEDFRFKKHEESECNTDTNQEQEEPIDLPPLSLNSSLHPNSPNTPQSINWINHIPAKACILLINSISTEIRQTRSSAYRSKRLPDSVSCRITPSAQASMDALLNRFDSLGVIHQPTSKQPSVPVTLHTDVTPKIEPPKNDIPPPARIQQHKEEAPTPLSTSLQQPPPSNVSPAPVSEPQEESEVEIEEIEEVEEYSEEVTMSDGSEDEQSAQEDPVEELVEAPEQTPPTLPFIGASTEEKAAERLPTHLLPNPPTKPSSPLFFTKDNKTGQKTAKPRKSKKNDAFGGVVAQLKFLPVNTVGTVESETGQSTDRRSLDEPPEPLLQNTTVDPQPAPEQKDHAPVPPKEKKRVRVHRTRTTIRRIERRKVKIVPAPILEENHPPEPLKQEDVETVQPEPSADKVETETNTDTTDPSAITTTEPEIPPPTQPDVPEQPEEPTVLSINQNSDPFSSFFLSRHLQPLPLHFNRDEWEMKSIDQTDRERLIVFIVGLACHSLIVPIQPLPNQDQSKNPQGLSDSLIASQKAAFLNNPLPQFGPNPLDNLLFITSEPSPSFSPSLFWKTNLSELISLIRSNTRLFFYDNNVLNQFCQWKKKKVEMEQEKKRKEKEQKRPIFLQISRDPSTSNLSSTPTPPQHTTNIRVLPPARFSPVSPGLSPIYVAPQAHSANMVGRLAPLSTDTALDSPSSLQHPKLDKPLLRKRTKEPLQRPDFRIPRTKPTIPDQPPPLPKLPQSFSAPAYKRANPPIQSQPQLTHLNRPPVGGRPLNQKELEELRLEELRKERRRKAEESAALRRQKKEEEERRQIEMTKQRQELKRQKEEERLFRKKEDAERLKKLDALLEHRKGSDDSTDEEFRIQNPQHVRRSDDPDPIIRNHNKLKKAAAADSPRDSIGFGLGQEKGWVEMSALNEAASNITPGIYETITLATPMEDPFS